MTADRVTVASVVATLTDEIVTGQRPPLADLPVPPVLARATGLSLEQAILVLDTLHERQLAVPLRRRQPYRVTFPGERLTTPILMQAPLDVSCSSNVLQALPLCDEIAAVHALVLLLLHDALVVDPPGSFRIASRARPTFTPTTRLAAALAAHFHAERLAPGTELPSNRRLGAAFRASGTGVLKAFALLEPHGIVERPGAARPVRFLRLPFAKEHA